MDGFDQDDPEHWLALITQYIKGFQKNTTLEEISKPNFKPALVNIYPWFVWQYAFIVVFGVLANAALIIYALRHRFYRDVTHAFIINLSLCHLVQCTCVLPMTLLMMIIKNWVYGQFMCFFIPLLQVRQMFLIFFLLFSYFLNFHSQDIPLHVALISHLLIAWDRFRWLGDPLKNRLPSFVWCCATWLTGMVIALPYPIYTTYIDLGVRKL